MRERTKKGRRAKMVNTAFEISKRVWRGTQSGSCE